MHDCMAGSHAYEIVNKGHPKYVPYLMFPHPHDQIFKQSMVCASIKDLMFIIYLQLHNVIMEIFTFQQLLCNVSYHCCLSDSNIKYSM